MEKKYKILKIVIIVFKIVALLMASLFIVFFIGEFNVEEFRNLSYSTWVLFLFVPILYIFSAIITIFKEKLGSILMIISVLGFNIISFFAEKSITDFDFFIFIIPAIIILIVKSYIKKTMKN
jgi:hypothetical protein